MNNEHLLILSIVKYKNLKKILPYFNENEFKIEENKQYFAFIKDYYKKYLDIPSLEMMKQQFNAELVFPENLEKEQVYADIILDKNNREKLLIVMKSVSEKIVNNKDLKKVYDFLLNNVRRVNLLKDEMFSGNIGTNTQERLTRYLDMKSNQIKKYKWGFGLNERSLMDNETPLTGGRLYLIQARPGVGKTFFICASAAYLSDMGFRPLFITKEMSVEEVLERADCFMSGVSFNRLKRGLLSEDEFEKYKKYLISVQGKKDLEVKYPKVCNQTIIRQMIEESNPDVVFIDYLQLLRDENKESDKRLQVANIIYDLKTMSQIYKIPIVVISASNRASVNNKEDEGPGLENIAESDAASYAIDVMFSLYQSEEEELACIMNLKCGKNRHGKKFHQKFMWNIDDSIIKEQN